MFNCLKRFKIVSFEDPFCQDTINGVYVTILLTGVKVLLNFNIPNYFLYFLCKKDMSVGKKIAVLSYLLILFHRSPSIHVYFDSYSHSSDLQFVFLVIGIVLNPNKTDILMKTNATLRVWEHQNT